MCRHFIIMCNTIKIYILTLTIRPRRHLQIDLSNLLLADCVSLYFYTGYMSNASGGRRTVGLWQEWPDVVLAESFL